MAKDKKRMTPAKPCVCGACGVQAHAIGGTKHRRCAGQMITREDGSTVPGMLRDAWEKLPIAKRGTWS